MYDETWKTGGHGRDYRNKNLQFTYILAIGVVLLLSSSRAFGTNDENHIQEIMAGANGNSKIQFVVIKQEGGGNLWGPQAGETQSRVMLVFFDAAGRETGKFKFPHSAPLDTNTQLIATQEFANLPGAPVPDFIMPPLLSPISGKVCFTNNPLNVNAFPRTDCVSYGSFPADQTGSDSGGCNGTVAAGPPTAALTIMNPVSLIRTSTSCGSVPNSDFMINTAPSPTNDAGKTLTIPQATQRAQGENLFNGETFQGNGRICATCHVASLNFALPPSNIQSRFSTVSATFDPLFIGETTPSSFDAGFDFNLNTLVLTQTVGSGTPCIGTLQGIITSGSGATAARAKVLTQVSPTTYLVMGGMNPALSGDVSDTNSCTGTVASITAGSLGAIAGSSVLGLEDPKRMRTSAAVNFPQGRGLILENIDGFPPTAPVFRKSPHLLNLSQRQFGPFGLSGSVRLSGSVNDLQSFATGAVIQHFPRTLARNSGGSDPDFRLPTPDELAAIEAFMRSLDFPSGTDPNKFDLNRFILTAAQQRGFDAFFGAGKCALCHNGRVFSDFSPINTGVVNQTINSAGADNLPCEPSNPCGSRTFITRQLFNIANLGPFFHDGSAATLKDVLAFYNSSFFNTSPGEAFSGQINTVAIGPTATDDIIAFLEGISFSPFAPTFGPVGMGVTISGTTFAGASAVSFNGVAATFSVSPSGTITTTVPAGATTGPITVTTPGNGPIVTTTRFTITPAITSFAPTFGPVGTGVTILGTTFTGVTAVSFGGRAATFTVSDSGTIATTVPAGATTGPIAVTTLDGTAISAASFTAAPFALNATPSSQTIAAGASTSYTLTISRQASFADNLTFSVTGLPGATTATFSPNPTTGNSSTMTVITTARPAQVTPWQTLWSPPANFGVRAWPLAICLLVIVLLAYRQRARRQIPRWAFATGAFAVLLCIGCGGGGSTPPPPPPPPGTPPGTFTLTVTATSSNASVQPVSMPVTLIVK
jgi:cytochrome c peroxidase